MRALLLTALFLLAFHGTASPQWQLPKSLPPEEYGTLLLSRSSEQNGVKPAVFSHWVHRRKHTCRVCHFEIEFNMKANTSGITEAASKGGKYCGTSRCHDGTAVFGHDEANCGRCHRGVRTPDRIAFATLAPLPKDRYGNGVNWVKALEQGQIAPAAQLALPPADMSFDKRLKLEAEWRNIPAAVFPHREHVAWLDCNTCHPDIFNIKKKTTQHFAMDRILKGEFCGVCHLTVAFPMDDCKRCHPKIR